MIDRANQNTSAPAIVSTQDNQDTFAAVPVETSAVIRKHSRSFSLAARWLPVDVRGDVEKLYAWCRWCDEAVDGDGDPNEAASRLAVLREDVQRVFEGKKVQHPASEWLADLVQSRGIQQAEALDLLAGMEMDLHLGQVENEEGLLRYSYCAAGVVGLMMCRVMGVKSQIAEKHAIDLGVAMQLTNIARDVAEDWNRGRCYIPKTWLQVELPGHASSQIDCENGSVRPPSHADISKCVERLLAMAELRYTSGLQGIAMLPLGCRPAIDLAAKLYREIGREILRREMRVMDGRIAVSGMRITFVACNALLLSLTSYATGAMLSTWLPEFVFQSNKDRMMTISKEQKMRDAKYLAYLGISLTSFMGSALFVMVAMNPKDPSYSVLPILYAIGCVGIGIVTNVLARRSALQECEARSC
jgi:phytoene synthase